MTGRLAQLVERTSTRTFSTPVLALLSAILLALAFPTFSLSWLAFVALVPLLRATGRATAWRAAWLGLIAGTVFSTINLFWLTHAMAVYGHIPRVLAVGPLMLLALYLGAYVGAFAMGWAWLAPRGLVGQILVPPTLWTALEIIRTYALTGFPWGFLAYTQAENLPLIQTAAWTGMYGVSWIVALANAGLAAAMDREVPLVRHGIALAAIAALIGGASFLGAGRLGIPPRGQPFQVAVLQGNVPQDMK